MFTKLGVKETQTYSKLFGDGTDLFGNETNEPDGEDSVLLEEEAQRVRDFENLFNADLSKPKGVYDLKTRLVGFVEDDVKFACAICQMLPRKFAEGTTPRPGMQREDGRFMQDTGGVC